MVEAVWLRYAASAGSVLRNPLQRDGRRFTKGSAIRHSKATELQELMISGDLGDAHCRRIGAPQRGARLVQSLQQQVSHGTYAEEFRATHPQCSLGHSDVSA